MAILKTIDSIAWLGGLEKNKIQEIGYLIAFHEEVENSEYTPAVMERCKDCVSGYESYDVKLYIESC